MKFVLSSGRHVKMARWHNAVLLRPAAAHSRNAPSRPDGMVHTIVIQRIAEVKTGLEQAVSAI